MLTLGIVCGVWSVEDEELGDDNVQAKAMFRQCLGNVSATFRQFLGNVKAMFRQCLGNV